VDLDQPLDVVRDGATQQQAIGLDHVTQA
jgi:hypothetical protein